MVDENDLLQSREALQAEKKGDDKKPDKKPEDLHYVDAKVKVSKLADEDLFKWCAQLQSAVGAPVTARDFGPSLNQDSILMKESAKMIL